jgi:hypothetical protein
MFSTRILTSFTRMQAYIDMLASENLSADDRPLVHAALRRLVCHASAIADDVILSTAGTAL